MRITTSLLAFAAAGLLVGATLLPQDAAHGMPPMPTASPEHAMLKQRVGTWDAAFKMKMGPQTIEDKATMTYRMLGEFWVVGDYDGHIMGGPFQGHEMSTYDPESKQFVSCWIDSTSPMMTELRGTWDPTSKTLTLKSLQNDPMTGVKTISKTVMKDADTILYTMTPEGATEATMEITYTRHK